jgi:hypothetical protein
VGRRNQSERAREGEAVEKMTTADQFIEFLSDYQGGMSQFQDDYLVTVRAGLTNYGMYKQALREMMTRLRSIAQAYYTHEILDIEIAELMEQAEMAQGYELARIVAELKLKRVNSVFEQKRVSELEAELSRFWQQAHHFKALVGEITPERRRELENEYWDALLTERFVLSGGVPNDKLLRDVGSMPPTLRREMVLKYTPENYSVLRQQYLERELPALDNMPLIGERMDKEKIEKILSSGAFELEAQNG